MPSKNYTSQQLFLDISAITNDITKAIEDLNHINQLVKKETEISSYEEKFCKQCKEPCGRSNAEIFNCMMTKINKNQTNNEINHYTKEYLEHDLQALIKKLAEKQARLQKIMENIQKHNLHS